MAENCLLTKLKGQVDNYWLEKFGVINLFFPANTAETILCGSSDNNVKFVCDNGAHFESTDGQTNYGEEFTVPSGFGVGDTPAIKVVGSSSNFHVYMENPKNITRLMIPATAILKSVKGALNIYRGLLRYHRILTNNMPDFTGKDIVETNLLVNLGLFTTAATGDIKDYPVSNALTSFNISSSKIFGRLEDWLEKEYLVRTNTNILTIYVNNLVTFNGLTQQAATSVSANVLTSVLTVKINNVTVGTYDGTSWTYPS